MTVQGPLLYIGFPCMHPFHKIVPKCRERNIATKVAYLSQVTTQPPQLAMARGLIFQRVS